MPEKLFTIKEAAAELGLSETELKTLTDQGKIPVYKVGGVFLRYDRAELSAFKERISKRGVTEVAVIADTRVYAASGMSFFEKISDFFYFYDFYILSAIVILLILYAIVYL